MQMAKENSSGRNYAFGEKLCRYDPEITILRGKVNLSGMSEASGTNKCLLN